MYKFGCYVGQKRARLLNNDADADGNVKRKFGCVLQQVSGF
jgi:hypothetical protein